MSTLDRSGLHSPSPIYGIRQGFTIADLNQSGALSVVALTAVTTPTTSSAINLGARSVQILMAFADGATTCDVQLFTSSGGDVLIKTFTGITYTNADGLYVGSFDTKVSLGGLPLKVRVQNIVGSGAITVSLQRTS